MAFHGFLAAGVASMLGVICDIAIPWVRANGGVVVPGRGLIMPSTQNAKHLTGPCTRVHLLGGCAVGVWTSALGESTLESCVLGFMEPFRFLDLLFFLVDSDQIVYAPCLTDFESQILRGNLANMGPLHS